MPDYADRVRYFNTPDELDDRLAKTMIGYDATNDRLGVKRLRDGQMVYFSGITETSNNVFSGYTASGGHGIDEDGEYLTIVTEERKDSAYTHAAASDEIRIEKDGDYEITVEASFNMNEDDIVELAIFYDVGDGFVLMPAGISNCGT